MIKFKIHNSLTDKLEDFEPLEKKCIQFYICGPTVYDHSHLGHARYIICLDILRRIISNYFNYNINFCMNITDIDDKIIQKAAENNVSEKEISEKYEKEFFEDMKKLNVLYPSHVARVTDYIPEMINFITDLMDENFAYKAQDGIYFNSERYLKKHEKMPRWNLNYENKKTDFCLWKYKKSENEISWESIYGKGRPGWSLECSVLSKELLGKKIDIHSGGSDLAFPHHTNEILQSQACCDKDEVWCKTFLHIGTLSIDGLKMSKSLKNFTQTKDLLKECNSNVIRLLCLTTQYADKIHYNESLLLQCKKKDKEIQDWIFKSQTYINSKEHTKMNENDKKLLLELEICKENVNDSLCMNLNYVEAMLDISVLMKNSNIEMDKESVSKYSLHSVVNYILFMFNIFGLSYDNKQTHKISNRDDNKLLNILCEFRDDVKCHLKNNFSKKGFEICDKMRNQLIKENIQIVDTKNGSVCKFIK